MLRWLGRWGGKELIIACHKLHPLGVKDGDAPHLGKPGGLASERTGGRVCVRVRVYNACRKYRVTRACALNVPQHASELVAMQADWPLFPVHLMATAGIRRKRPEHRDRRMARWLSRGHS
eukprot:5048403-Amphidinium_carterae.1